ncbi:predicted protein [Brucella sp. 83/13]|nr:predicted protein [Brucella sp. 83/13]
MLFSFAILFHTFLVIEKWEPRPDNQIKVLFGASHGEYRASAMLVPEFSGRF